MSIGDYLVFTEYRVGLIGGYTCLPMMPKRHARWRNILLKPVCKAAQAVVTAIQK